MPFKMANALEDILLNFFLRSVGYSFPSTVYIGLFTSFTEASDGSSFTEVSALGGTGYTRRPITFGAPTTSVAQNSAKVSFPMALSVWGTVTHVGIFDSLSGGNMWYWGPMTFPSAVGSGQQMEFDIGTLQLSLTSHPTSAVANDIINMTVRGIPRSVPAAQYIALLTAFTSDSVYTECVDAGYARQIGAFSPSSGGVTANTNLIAYGSAVSGFTVSHAAIFDAVSGGNMLIRGPLPTPKVVAASSVFKFLAGDLTVKAD